MLDLNGPSYSDEGGRGDVDWNLMHAHLAVTSNAEIEIGNPDFHLGQDVKDCK